MHMKIEERPPNLHGPANHHTQATITTIESLKVMTKLKPAGKTASCKSFELFALIAGLQSI